MQEHKREAAVRHRASSLCCASAAVSNAAAQIANPWHAVARHRFHPEPDFPSLNPCHARPKISIKSMQGKSGCIKRPSGMVECGVDRCKGRARTQRVQRHGLRVRGRVEMHAVAG